MNDIKMNWLDTRLRGGIVTFGVPHKRGEVKKNEKLLIMQDDKAVDAEFNPIAYWNDGSVKWTSVTADLSESPVIIRKGEHNFSSGMEVSETDESITVFNGIHTVVFCKKGKVLAHCKEFSVGLKVVKTVFENNDDIEIKKNIPYYGEISECLVEATGAFKTVILIKGTHKASDGSDFLRFTVRFKLYRNSNRVDIKHTFIYDGDAAKDFIGGVAVEIKRNMSGTGYNRRIKIAGDYGVMHEPLRILNLWRPKIGCDYYKAQMRGENVDITDAIDSRNGEKCADMIDNTTYWDSYKYVQITPDSFYVKKRTVHKNCCYIDSNFGKRAKGMLYAGDENGGIAVGLRHFFEKAPSAINVEGLSTDEGKITAWIHPTDAPPLDMRHYDTIGHDQTYYEGYPWVGSDPYGVAATNELSFYLYNSTPCDDEILKEGRATAKPAVLVCSPQWYKETNVLGIFSLPDKSTPLKAWLEGELDKAADFYMKEVDQRHWYGMYNYGDVMHSYDSGRHCWKYDLGGYAWQNTELVPTLWLWYAFLRSGRGEIFDFAEAMSRHAADVDVYHIGDKKGLGSRHNVIHWGDSCKEPRIAMAGHHRALYYIMGGDCRIGEVFEDVLDADYSTLKTDPLGFFYKKEEMKLPTHARSGPDWSTYCSNWYTEWERNANTKYRDKIQTGIDDLKNAPMRMISGSNFEYDPKTGHLGYIGESAAGGSHLAACMGGPQTWMELVELLGDETFRDMMIQYGKFYYLPIEEKRKISNGIITGNGFVYPYMAAGMVGFAAREIKDEKLAYQVWQVLIHSLAGENKDEGFDCEFVENYFNNKNLREMFWISTNFTAQWCLNTIVCLELTKDYMLPDKDDYKWENWVK